MTELDDLDIYNDLDEFQEQQEKKSKELQALETKYAEALQDIEIVQQENKRLKKNIKTLEVNFQNLLDTAKAEIRRKNQLIDQLRKEKDDLCFRRIHTRNPFKQREETTTIDQDSNDKVVAKSFDKKPEASVGNVSCLRETTTDDEEQHESINKCESNVERTQKPERKAVVVKNNVKEALYNRESKADKEQQQRREHDRQQENKRRERNRKDEDEVKDCKNIKIYSELRERERAHRHERDYNTDRGDRRTKCYDSRRDNGFEYEQTRHRSRSHEKTKSENRSRSRGRRHDDPNRFYEKRSRSIEFHLKHRESYDTNKEHKSKQDRNKSHGSDGEVKSANGLKRERCQEYKKDGNQSEDSEISSKRQKIEESEQNVNHNAVSNNLSTIVTKLLYSSQQNSELEQNKMIGKLECGKSTEETTVDKPDIFPKAVNTENLLKNDRAEMQIDVCQIPFLENFIENKVENVNEGAECKPETKEYDRLRKNAPLKAAVSEERMVDDYLELFAETDISDTETPDNTPMKKAPDLLLTQLCEPIESDEEMEELDDNYNDIIQNLEQENIESKEKQNSEKVEITNRAIASISEKTIEIQSEKKQNVEEGCKACEEVTLEILTIEKTETEIISKTSLENLETNEREVKVNGNDVTNVSSATASNYIEIIDNLSDQKSQEEGEIILDEHKECEKTSKFVCTTQNNMKSTRVQKSVEEAAEKSNKAVEKEESCEKEAKERITEIKEIAENCHVNKFDLQTIQQESDALIIQDISDKVQNINTVENNENLIKDKSVLGINQKNSTTGKHISSPNKLGMQTNQNWFGFKIPKKSKVENTEEAIVVPQELCENEVKDKIVINISKRRSKHKHRNIKVEIATKATKTNEKLLENNENSNDEKCEQSNEFSIKKPCEEDQINEKYENATNGENTSEISTNECNDDNARNEENLNKLPPPMSVLVEEIFDKSTDEAMYLVAPQLTPGSSSYENDNDIELRMRSIFQSPENSNACNLSAITNTIAAKDTCCMPDITLEETTRTEEATTADSSNTLNSSTETKKLTMGTSKYVFEKVSENVVNLYITRNRGKKKKKILPNTVISAAES